MALLYVFTVTHPVGTEPWPPAVKDSAWQAQRTLNFKDQKYFRSYGLADRELRDVTGNMVDVRLQMIFDNEADLQAYITSTKIPDDLQAAVNDWKATYGIVFDHKVYQLPEASLSFDINWVS